MHSLQFSLQNTTMILGVDLYPRWVGTESVLQGESPYSQETREQIWLAIYGSTDKPNGNIFGFYYPPAITTLFMPFVLAGIPVGWAAALWCAFLWAILSTALVFWVINFQNSKSSLFIIPILFLSGWLFRPAFSNYLLGQFALFSVLTALGAWLLLRSNRPVWAGIFAALSLVKPSLTIIPIGLLFIEHWRKPKGILAFLATSLVLYLPPTFLLGWWLPDFLSDISHYAIENRVSWSIADIGSATGLFWLFASILLIGIGIYKKESLLMFASASALNAIFVPHTADYDLVAFIPLLVYLGEIWLRKDRMKSFHALLYFAFLWFPWLSLIAVLIMNQESNAVESWYRLIWLVYPPVILLLSLYTKMPDLKLLLKREKTPKIGV